MTSRKKAYFAHPISAYCSPEEDQALRTIACAGFLAVNPSEATHQKACGHEMERWAALAGACDAVVALPFPDGAIGSGVAMEVEALVKQGKPVFLLDTDGRQMTRVQDWPNGLEILDIASTRARIRAFREQRVAQGLVPTPVREDGTVGRGWKP